MGVRRAALEAFYGGPVWKAHGRVANATMLDSDDVLLLRPLTPDSGFAELPPRPEDGALESAPVLIATLCSLDGPADVPAIEDMKRPALVASGLAPLAVFVEEPSKNTFPALAVRMGEHVLVWIQRLCESPDPRVQACVSVLASSCRAWSGHRISFGCNPRRGRGSDEGAGAGTMTASDFAASAGDFDFLVGRWQVSNRRLHQRHVGSDDWNEFVADYEAWTHLDGALSVDEFRFRDRGASACAVRSLDREVNRWSIYWITSITGRLGEPVHGGWSGTAASSTETTATTGCQSRSGSSGRVLVRTRHAGSRRSTSTTRSLGDKLDDGRLAAPDKQHVGDLRERRCSVATGYTPRVPSIVSSRPLHNSGPTASALSRSLPCRPHRRRDRATRPRRRRRSAGAATDGDTGL